MGKTAHEESDDTREHKQRSAHSQPDQSRIADSFTPLLRRAFKATAQLSLPQKSIVMPLEQMGLNLPHGIEDDANDNQDARSTEKLCR